MIDFKQDYILENSLVKLAPLRKEDIALLLPFAETEPNLWQFSLQSAAGFENMSKYIASAIKDRQNQRSYPFLVIDKHTDTVAGSTRFYDYQSHHSTVQLGYTWYGKSFQGTGLNKQCKFLMLDFAFDKMKVERVELRADAQNIRSIAAMKSIGCVEEGILRSNCAAPNGRRDSIILSILRKEWNASKKQALIAKCYPK